MSKQLLGSLELNRIYQRDCLEGSRSIGSGSVDLILTDLPYGNMNTDGGRKLGINGWDHAIEPSKILDVANRILRRNGKMILFSQEPYTTELINNAIPNLPFSYRAVWEKDNFANALGVNKAMVSFYEDVLIFSKLYDTDAIHPLRPYFKDVLNFIGLNLKQINSLLSHRRAEHTFYINSTQYALCTEQTYNELINVFSITKMEGFKPYVELKSVDEQFKKDLPSVFNLWEGKKYKSNILRYKKDYDGYHPTQKPVLLLEDLIKTFSNEGDLIVDLTCGSGSTCVAAVRTGRNFIGFETEPKYVEIANKRLDNELEAR
jgi:site-specific DNA-methyltransferase (adenine-specific)